MHIHYTNTIFKCQGFDWIKHELTLVILMSTFGFYVKLYINAFGF